MPSETSAPDEAKTNTIGMRRARALSAADCNVAPSSFDRAPRRREDTLPRHHGWAPTQVFDPGSERPLDQVPDAGLGRGSDGHRFMLCTGPRDCRSWRVERR